MKIIMLASGTINSTLTYRILSFAKCLVRKGHSVSIIAPSLDKYSDYKRESFSEVKGIKIIRPFQFNTKNRLVNLVPYILHTLIILHKKDYDIVHLYKPTPITIPGIVPKFTRKKAIIVDMDDLGSKVMVLENNPKIMVKLVEICETVSLKYSDGIICASNYLKSKYTAMFPQKNIVWVSNGIDSDYIMDRKKQKSGKRIIAIGSLNRENIISPLIKAIPRIVREYKYSGRFVYILGDGQALPYFKNLVKKLKVSKYVKFTGWVQMNEIPKFTKFGDIGYAYMPNEETIKACSNLKAFQYMAMGMVPVVSNVGDLPLYVDKGKAGYIIESDNSDALSTGLIKILKSQNSLNKSSYALNFVKKHYTWDIITKRVENFYKEVYE